MDESQRVAAASPVLGWGGAKGGYAALESAVLTGRFLLFSGWFSHRSGDHAAVQFLIGGEVVHPALWLRTARPEIGRVLDLAPQPMEATSFFAGTRLHLPRQKGGTVALTVRFGLGETLRVERQISADEGELMACLLRLGAKERRLPSILGLLKELPTRVTLRYVRHLAEVGDTWSAGMIWDALTGLEGEAASQQAWFDTGLDICLAELGGKQRAYADDAWAVRLEQHARLGMRTELLDGAAVARAAPVLAGLGREDLACEMARHALRRARGRSEVHAAIAALLPRQTASEVRTLLLLEPQKPDQDVAGLLAVIAGSLAASGQTDIGQTIMEAAAAIDRGDEISAFNAGNLALSCGRFGEAAANFARVRRAFPFRGTTAIWPGADGRRWPHWAPDASIFRDCIADIADWPRITVITPSLNQGQFIEETILSVLNQGYPNLCYIVVDGGSTDNSRTILRRYGNAIDHLILEPDSGQSEAINKGLALAEEGLVLWLNSDDMLAPGALFMAAAAYVRTSADVIAGICATHRNHILEIINRPAVDGDQFNVTALADIFGRWLKGQFFYQPEVVFSTRILREVGGRLDDDLLYAMDYDLWLRMAKAGARIEVVPWPFAYFRRHDAQKTARLIDCIEEQAGVRDRYLEWRPRIGRQMVIDDRVRRYCNGPRRTAIVSRHWRKIFSPGVSADVAEAFQAKGGCATICADIRSPEVAMADLVLFLVHVQDEAEMIRAVRRERPDALIAGWFWDNHHHPIENHEIARELDIVIPGHATYARYLRSDMAYTLDPVPLCVTQWSRRGAESGFDRFGTQPRRNELFGGFTSYAFTPARRRLVEQMMEWLGQHALSLLTPFDLQQYFSQPEQDRFGEWAQYKTSLVLPLHGDLSQRLFDALLAGQIPLVPEDLTALDILIDQATQAELGIVRFRPARESLLAAHAGAIERFDKGGLAGIRRRHVFALERHMFSARVFEIADMIAAVPPGGARRGREAFVQRHPVAQPDGRSLAA